VQNRHSPEKSISCAGTRDLIHLNELTPTTRIFVHLAQDEPGNREWREYCLNATTLNALDAVQNFARATQYLRTPRFTGYLAGE
jgi:hypothetical protein